jgi:hypothetical protein
MEYNIRLSTAQIAAITLALRTKAEQFSAVGANISADQYEALRSEIIDQKHDQYFGCSYGQTLNS